MLIHGYRYDMANWECIDHQERIGYMNMQAECESTIIKYRSCMPERKMMVPD
jgi:hypothetical protein